MAWENSDRKSRLPSDWQARRKRVLARDRYRCRAELSTGEPCGADANQVDHVEHGDNHDERNLQALCAYHHKIKSALEGVAARKPRPSRIRTPEPHPSLRRV